MDPGENWVIVVVSIVFVIGAVLADSRLRSQLEDQSWGEQKRTILWEGIWRLLQGAIGIVLVIGLGQRNLLALTMIPGAAVFLWGAWRCWYSSRQMR